MKNLNLFYSQLSANGHSRRWPVLIMDTFFNSSFFCLVPIEFFITILSSLIYTFSFHIPFLVKLLLINMNKKLKPVFSTLCYFLFHQQHSIHNIMSTATMGDLDDISCKTCLQLKIVILKPSCC